MRPRKCRLVEDAPQIRFYKPQGVPMRELQVVPLKDEEWQAMKLIDCQGLDQAEAAGRMGISRPTFSRVLSSARRAVARALVDGAAIKIGGGDFLRVSAPERGCNMKVVISAKGVAPEDAVDPQFGRAPWMLLYDQESGELSAHANPGALTQQGAGVAAAQCVIGLKADVVITGICGPRAADVLKKAGIQVLSTEVEVVSEAVSAWLAGKLVAA